MVGTEGHLRDAVQYMYQSDLYLLQYMLYAVAVQYAVYAELCV
jgi:hypothetical protein